MKIIWKNLRLVRTVLLILFAALVVYFVYAINVYGGRWFTNPYNQRLQNQQGNVVAGSILDRSRTILAQTDEDGERQYSDDKTTRKAVSHIVGDRAGLTSSGAESFQARALLGFDANLFTRVFNSITGAKTRGNDVLLSIDSELCSYIYEEMGSYKGSVVVLNYKTGEMLASVSSPGYDAENPDAYRYATDEEKRQDQEDGDTSALVNRATMGQYTPGSVFKLVTAAAALRYLPDAAERTWDCSGPLVFDAESGKYLPDVLVTPEQDQEYRARQQDTREKGENADQATDDTFAEFGNYLFLRDYNSSYHGEITLEKAISKSCNHVFGQIALEIGTEKLAKVAKEFGIGENFLFSDLMVYSSSYVKGDTEYETAWSGVGQFKDILTPLHMTLITSSIANDGVMMEPKLVKGMIDSRGYVTNALKSKIYSKPLSASEAAVLKEYMAACVKHGTGTAAALKHYTVCGKTGTAEVSGDKEVGNHAWFTGFIDDEEHPYAITVILEHAGSGGGKAAPLAGDVLTKLIRLGY